MTSRIRSVGALSLFAFVLLVSSAAHAGLGKRDAFNWSWVDSKGTSGPRVVPRYVTPPALMAGATGNGTIDYPTLPAQVWNNTTKTITIPVETFTLTATSATTFTVIGTVSTGLADATVGTSYTTAAGMNFTITAGATPFAAGDTFTFSVVDHLNVSAIPGAVSRQMPAGAFVIVPNPGFTLETEGLGSSGAVVVYAAGYLAVATSNSPTYLQGYYPPTSQNTALPARVHSHESAVPVMPFWDDLVPKATSRVWTAAVGRAASRVFVVEYNDFAHKDDATASFTFQVVFFENGDSKVRFHYVAMSGAHADGSSASIGLQPRLTSRWTADTYSVNTPSIANGLTIELGLDFDGDRLPNGIEAQYGTSASTSFTDAGSPPISDSAQILAGLDPTSGTDNASMSTDTDADTLVDVEEAALGTNPNAKDTDADGLDDNIELNVTDPLVADTDGDGLSDGQEDTDKSGSVTGTETNPTIWDTDDDGISDGTEVAQSTDPKSLASGRLSAALQLGAVGSVQNLSSAVDSKGNLHVAWITRSSSSRNNTPNELHVALLSETGSVFAISVADTLITAHTGMDDSIPSVVTTPGTGAVDRTLIVNGTPRGYSFLTEIDFNAAARDGTASTSAALVKTTRMLAIGVGVDHPVVKIGGGKLHLVFQGQEAQGYNNFSGQQAIRGTYYVQLTLDGDVAVQPTLMFQKGVPAHHRTLPRIAVDGMGNIHSVVRGGTCRYNQGPSDCALYYTKLSSAGAVLVPTTKLQLEGNGGYHRSPEILVSPNGLVNHITSTTAPLISGNNAGAYSIGNEVRLYSFAVINNQIQTVINQKTLMSVAPGMSTGLARNTHANAYRTPTATLDAGGNIHLVVCEDNNLSDGEYRAFAPNGDSKIGPYYVRGYYYWGLDSIGLAGPNTVLFTYKASGGNRPAFRQLDITGSMLDLSGNSQVPLPTAGALTVTGVSPAVVGVDSRTVVTVSGTGFIAGTQVSVGGVATTNVQAFDASNVLGTLDSATLAPGVYDVVVQNPDGAMATLAGALTVTAGTEPQPEPQPTPTDDGCCHVGGKSPIGSALLAAFVFLGLARRRRRKTLPAAGALLIVAALVAPRAAHAGLGTPDTAGWNWVDTKGATGIHLIPRYVTPPVLAAGATGNGTINDPTLPTQLWSYATNAPTIPLETFTLTATSATTFNVVGSVSGTLAVATVDTTYTTAAGMNLTITAGATPFAAGDHFDFAIVDHITASTVPGATSRPVPTYGHALLPAPGFSIFAEGVSGNRALVAYDAGYLMFTTTSSPSILTNYYPRNGANTALPARLLAHQSSVPVMPFWDDLVSKATSRIWTATVGRPGERRFVVEWNDFAHKGDATASYTFQVVFFEGQERVRFHYITMTNGEATSGNGSTATVGLQARLNTQFAAASYSVDASTIADGLAIEFSRDSDGDHVPSYIEQQYGTSDGTRFTDAGSPAVSDGGQLQSGIDPTNPADNGSKGTDTDGDLIVDVDEQVLGTNPALKDTDADGLDDNVELGTGTEPLVADTDGDGLSDGQEDVDKSGGVTGTETSPLTWDSDDDGVGDGTEVAQATDPKAPASGRMSVPITIASPASAYYEESSLDSKGNLHVMWVTNRGNNDVPDELFVALLQPTGGVYAVTVAATMITAHAGLDDRIGTIATLPGAGAIDRTFIVNSTDRGYAFLTEIDFNAATRDGTASTSDTIVASTRMIPVSLGIDHPVIKESGGKLAVVFQGQELLGSPDKFANNQIARGTYYMQLSIAGDVLVQPTLMFQKGIPAHHHHFPQIAVDGMGNVHSVVRGGTCRKSQGPTDCALYYTKLSSAGATVVPTTKLQLEGNGGIHRSPSIAVSPNGLVNLLYSTSAPMITANGQGAYAVGNEVRLHSFSTVNNQITTVINQKTLLSYAPDRTMALPANQRLASWRIPFVTLDDGGNLHVFVVEDNVTSSMGFYFAFAPNGDKKLGPYKLPSSTYWGTDSLHASATQVLFATKNSYQGGFRQLDITGSGLDLTGASLVPLPDAGILVLRSVSPDTVAVGTGKIVVTIAGAGFVSGTAVAIGGVPVANTLAYDGGTVIGELDATGLAEGPYDVVVQNPNGAMVTLTGGFYVGERPVTEPEPEPTPTDDGCCSVGGKSPVSSLLLAGLVAGLLGGRRRRR